MSKPVEFILLNRPSEIARLQDELESLGRQEGLAPKVLHDVQLAVEEHLTNILNHGFSDQRDHQIKVQLRSDESEFCIEVEDDGRPFNPLDQPAPNLSLPIEQRPIGGLGILMIRQAMDRVEYRRADGKNILLMVKRLKPG